MAVQYPGRGDRLPEAPVASVAEMSTHVVAELMRLEPRELVLFGHSLGALVAYETAMALRDRNRPPHYLFVSGSRSPWRAGRGHVHLATDEDLWSSVCELGGVEQELMDNLELRDLVLPALRSDLMANETYQPRCDAEPLPCAVRCYYSPEDPLANGPLLGEWTKATDEGLTLCARPGGHFHLQVDTAGLVDDIMTTLAGKCESVRA